MASSTAQTRVVIPADEAESIKSNLKRVQDELAKVRDKAREEAETLDRIHGMIDLKYLNDLLSAVESLETRVKAMESDSEADIVRTQLDQEQQRLAKLWDAFKEQEDEILRLRTDRDALVARLDRLEADWKALGTPAGVQSKIGTLERENARMQAALRKAADRSDDYRKEFEEEQQRLAKLFKVYEDVAAQLEAYKKASDEWHAWRQQHWSSLPAAAKRDGNKIGKV